MKAAVIGLFGGALLVLVLGPHADMGWAQTPAADALSQQRPQPVIDGGSAAAVTAASSDGGLIAMSMGLRDDRQQLTIIDPVKQVVCVYHVDGLDGKIALRSVRRIHWDMEIVDFNGVAPSPREISTQLQQVNR
jgi:hypothetical protein